MSSLSWPFALAERPAHRPDVICMGHALVDRLAETSSEVVVAAGLEPGAMTLVDADEAHAIEIAYDGWSEVAGGSAANTAAGVASLGGVARFIGSVGADEAGHRYIADLEAAGVRCVTPEVRSGHPTGVCHVFVGPGGERTMGTHLGAAAEVSPAAVDEARVAEAPAVYMEGYLLDPQVASAAFRRLVEVARDAGTIVAISLSDPFVVERHHDTVLGLLDDGLVDLLVGNEDEARALAGEASLEVVSERLVRPGFAFVVTQGAAGSVVLTSGGMEFVPAVEVERVVDTTGAGDLFAAGVLFGLAQGESPRRCLELGSIAAAEIISHLGARPLVDLSTLLGAGAAAGATG